MNDLVKMSVIVVINRSNLGGPVRAQISVSDFKRIIAGVQFMVDFYSSIWKKPAYQVQDFTPPFLMSDKACIKALDLLPEQIFGIISCDNNLNNLDVNILGYHNIVITNQSYLVYGHILLTNCLTNISLVFPPEVTVSGVIPEPEYDSLTVDQKMATFASKVICHEVLEMLANPNTVTSGPQSDVLLEICDFVSADSVALTLDDTTVMMSNFVYPSWYDSSGSAPYDALGILTQPYSISPGGYIP